MSDSPETAPLRRTPLYDLHRAKGARMVAFAGYEMPVQYASIIDEHRTVRSAVGLFDLSHMGEIEVAGKDALAAVNEALRLDPNNAQAWNNQGNIFRALGVEEIGQLVAGLEQFVRAYGAPAVLVIITLEAFGMPFKRMLLDRKSVV